MPLVIADIAPELVAALALVAVLCVYFMVESLQGIARFIGMPNWPLIGKGLYNGISAAVTWVGQQLNWLWQHANPVSMFLATTGWLLNEMTSLQGTVFADIYSAFERVTGSAIPGAITSAENLARTLYGDAVAFTTTEVGRAESAADALFNTAVADV